jgi:hypothetical protein
MLSPDRVNEQLKDKTLRPQSNREAWLRIRREDEIPPDAPNYYPFGFHAAMGR